MQIITDKNNFITLVSYGGIIPGGIELDEFEFVEDIQAYKYQNGKISLDKEKLAALKNEQRQAVEVQKLKKFLSETDNQVLQMLEEKELGLNTQRTRDEHLQLIRQRVEVRTKIQKLEVQDD